METIIEKLLWVCVEDRLPERMTSRDSNGAKIIHCCSNDVFGYDAWYKMGRLVCYNHESERWESHDAYRIGKITHWKPIISPEQEVELSYQRKESSMKKNRYRIIYSTFDGYQAECTVLGFTEQEAVENAKKEFMSIDYIDKVYLV